MKITVFGATGGTGQYLVEKALAHGHTVTAFVRSPEKLALTDDNLRILQGSVLDAESVSEAIAGADAVISALGPAPGSPDDLMEMAATNITRAMADRDVSRLVWATGAGVRTVQDEPTFMHRAFGFLLKLISGKVLQNSERGIAVIKNSPLDWTIARAPMLTDQPGSGNFHIGYVNAALGRQLSRENFAQFMLDLAEHDQWIHDMPAASDL